MKASSVITFAIAGVGILATASTGPLSAQGQGLAVGRPEWVAAVRAMRITPHVAASVNRHGGSAIDGRTLRHAGYAMSQRKRKLVEQAFGWMKTVGLLRKLRHRGGRLVDWIFTFAAAAYNLVRWRNLLAQAT